MAFSTVWLKGRGGEKSGWAHKFSLFPLQNTISPNWGKNWSEKWKKIFRQNYPYLQLTFLPFFLFFFFYFSFVTLACSFFFFSFSFFLLTFLLWRWLFVFFFFSLVLSSGGFFYFSFFFFLNFYFYYFFKKTLLNDFLCYFLKCPLSSIHNFLKKYNVLLFVLFTRDMMVNLYKPYFQPNQKVFYPSTFPPSQPNTNEKN